MSALPEFAGRCRLSAGTHLVDEQVSLSRRFRLSEKKKAISVAAVSGESEFKRVFNLGGDFATDGSQVDHLFGDG